MEKLVLEDEVEIIEMEKLVLEIKEILQELDSRDQTVALLKRPLKKVLQVAKKGTTVELLKVTVSVL